MSAKGLNSDNFSNVSKNNSTLGEYSGFNDYNTMNVSGKKKPMNALSSSPTFDNYDMKHPKNNFHQKKDSFINQNIKNIRNEATRANSKTISKNSSSVKVIRKRVNSNHNLESSRSLSWISAASERLYEHAFHKKFALEKFKGE